MDEKIKVNIDLNIAAIAAAFLLLGFVVGYVFHTQPATDGMNYSIQNTTIFKPDTTKINLIKSILEDYVFLQSGSEGNVLFTKSENKDSYVVLYYSVNGQEMPIYLTADMKYIITQLEGVENVAQQLKSARAQATKQTSNQSSQPKPQVKTSPNPTVELFVMSYCPYGLQAEKALLPVVNLLGNKTDIKIRFVYYAMHPSYGEVEENTRQYCIQKEEKEKFWDYLSCFVVDGKSEDCLTKAGIDREKLNTCYNATDMQYNITAYLQNKSTWLSGQFPLYLVDGELNQKYNIGGSPTLIINGVQVDAVRSPEGFKEAICASFDSPPSECQTSLSAAPMPPSFGYGGSTSSSSASCGG